jgi:hypothetical protein
MTAEQDFALVIGIAHYPQLRSLEGPVLDAKRVKSWLCEEAGLPEANIESVMSGEQVEKRPRPVREEVDTALDRILEKARAGSGARRLYVYFAGHGCSQAIEHLALIMANADPGHLNRAMNATEYRNALAQRLFPEQVYLFDCCRNYDDSVSGHGPDWTSDPEAAPVPNLSQVVLYAAGFHEYANERHLFYDERRGLFTEVLMEGLNGAAATFNQIAGRGMVTTDRLVPYVRDRLNDLTGKERVPTRQHLWYGALGVPRSLVLAEGIAPWRKQVNVTFPPGTAQVVVQDDRWQTQAIREVAAGETSVAFDLELASYTFTAQPADISSKPVRLLPDKPLASYTFPPQPGGISEPVPLLPDEPLHVNLGGS